MALIKAGNCGGAVASLAYDEASHTLTFQDGAGGVAVIPLNVGAVSCGADGHSLSYTDERGVERTCTFDDLIGVTELAYDHSTGVLSWKDKTGAPRQAQIGNTSVSYDPAAHQIKAVSPEHGEQVLTLNKGSLSIAGNVLRYTDETNEVTTIPLPTSSCSYDEASHTLTMTDASGVVHTCRLGVGKLELDPAGPTLKYTDERGAVTTFDIPAANLTYDSQAHALVFTDSSGAARTMPLNVGRLAYSQASHTLTYTDEKGVGTSLPLGTTSIVYDPTINAIRVKDERGIETPVLLGSTAVVYDPATHNLKVQRPGLPDTEIDLNRGDLDYDPNSHTLKYTDEQGDQKSIVLNVGQIAFDQATRTFTYTREDGTPQSVVIPEADGDKVNYDKDANTLTILHKDGSSDVVVLSGSGALTYDSTAHELRFTDDAGNQSVLQLNVGQIAYDPTAHRITYTDERGAPRSLDLDVATISWDNNTRKLTYTDERGTATSLFIPAGDRTSYDPVTKVITVTHDDGTTEQIPNADSSLTYDQNTETVTHTSGDGTVTSFPVDQVQFDYDPAAQTLTLEGRSGNRVVVPVCCPDKVVEEVRGCLVDNTDPAKPIITGVKALQLGTNQETTDLLELVDKGDCVYELRVKPAQPVPSGTAVNDYVGTVDVGTAKPIDVSVNDTACNQGATTSYQLVAGSEINCTVSGAGPNFTATPISAGLFQFEYQMLCDGAVVDTAIVSGTGAVPLAPTANAVNDSVGNVTVGQAAPVDVSVNDTACNQGATTTYQLKAGSQVNCTVTGTGPNFSVTPTAAGVFSFQYDILCNGTVVDTATVFGAGIEAPVPTADAADDSVGNVTVGQSKPVDVSVNDTACNQGATTTYQLKAGSQVNCTVTGTAPNFSVTPTAAGAFSFQYDILCDGTVVDTATVSGTGVAAPVPTADAVNDDVGSVKVGVDKPVDVSANDSPCTLGATTTYQLKAGSQVNCTVTGVGPTFNVKPNAIGAFSFQYDILCNGTVVDTATVSGTGTVDPTADAVDDDAGTRAPGEQFTFDVSTNDTGCDQGATTTFELVPGSEQNCTVAIDPATGVATITVNQ